MRYVAQKSGRGRDETADSEGEHELDRQSKPGRRIYHKVDDLPNVLNGMGIAVVSTSKGVMSDRKARENNVGGELLCTVS